MSEKQLLEREWLDLERGVPDPSDLERYGENDEPVSVSHPEPEDDARESALRDQADGNW